MSKKSVFCFVTSRRQAARIVDHLRSESFSKNDISVLFSDQGDTPGSFIGESLGWIAGIGVVAVPGLGPFIAAGPIVAALSGTAGGGIARGLMGQGISEMDAKRYERELDNGNILLSVYTDDAGDIARVKDIFKHAAARKICTSGEAATKTVTSSEGRPHPAEMALA